MRSHSPNSRYSHRFDEPNYTIQFENGTGKPVWADSRPSSTSIFKKLALVVLALFLLGIVTMFSVDSKVNIENRIPKKELNVEDYLRKTYGMGLVSFFFLFLSFFLFPLFSFLSFFFLLFSMCHSLRGVFHKKTHFHLFLLQI